MELFLMHSLFNHSGIEKIGYYEFKISIEERFESAHYINHTRKRKNCFQTAKVYL